MKPVLDLEAHEPVDSDVVPERHAEITAVRDKTCVFPWCARSARRCDIDHTIPAARGGPTCPCNLAPLCRRHHRIKTHGDWTYTTLEPGHYLWTSKHGYSYLRDPDGTLDVSRDRRRAPTSYHAPDPATEWGHWRAPEQRRGRPAPVEPVETPLSALPNLAGFRGCGGGVGLPEATSSTSGGRGFETVAAQPLQPPVVEV